MTTKTKTRPPSDSPAQVMPWPLDKIVDAADNPRASVGDIDELAASIEAFGLIQPVVVATTPNTASTGEVLVVAGHRRVAACRKLGMSEIEVLSRDGTVWSAQDRLVAMLVENVQRKDLTPMERARGFEALVGSGMTQRAAAAATGLSQATISKSLALLKLPEKARGWVDEGKLPIDTAVQLTSLPAAEVGRICSAGLPSASRVAVAHENHLREQKRKKVVDDLEAQGVEIVPSYRGVDVVGATYGVQMDEDAHRKEPCSAVVVAYDGRITWVCKDPDRHLSPKKSAAKFTDETIEDEDESYRADLRVREAATARRHAWLRETQVDPTPDVLAFVASAILGRDCYIEYPALEVAKILGDEIVPPHGPDEDWDEVDVRQGRDILKWADGDSMTPIWLFACSLYEPIRAGAAPYLAHLRSLGYEPEETELEDAGLAGAVEVSIAASGKHFLVKCSASSCEHTPMHQSTADFARERAEQHLDTVHESNGTIVDFMPAKAKAS